jgi:DNA-binding NtrC family response regulator
LRERAEDIPSFAQILLNRLTSDCGRESLQLSQNALMKLKHHYWPGNIRELRNVLERALMGAKSSIIEAQDLDFASSPSGPNQGMSTSMTLKELERHYIIQVLNEEGGHVDRAAKRLDIPRSTLYQKIKAYGPESSRF